MSAAPDWKRLLQSAVAAIFNAGLNMPLQVASMPVPTDELAFSAGMPLRLGDHQWEIRLQMGARLAIDVLARLGGGAARESDGQLMEEAVAESLNLVAGRLAGLLNDTNGSLELGTPQRLSGVHAANALLECCWVSDAGMMCIQLDLIS